MGYFSLQLEASDIPGYMLIKLDDYYYMRVKPRPLPHPGDMTPDFVSSQPDVRVASAQRPHYPQSSQDVAGTERSRTPPPPQPSGTLTHKTHRRSVSLGYPHDTFPMVRVESTCGSEVDVELAMVEVGSGYEGGLSADDTSSLCDLPAKGSPTLPEAMAVQPWVVLRVLPSQVDVYFQLHGSEIVSEAWQAELDRLLHEVISALKRSCHRTNQWLLMRDMLETRTCSPYLLSQSASEAWVEEVVLQHNRTETFRAQEFKCDLVYRFNITPHWRIREMRGMGSTTGSPLGVGWGAAGLGVEHQRSPLEHYGVGLGVGYCTVSFGWDTGVGMGLRWTLLGWALQGWGKLWGLGMGRLRLSGTLCYYPPPPPPPHSTSSPTHHQVCSEHLCSV